MTESPSPSSIAQPGSSEAGSHRVIALEEYTVECSPENRLGKGGFGDVWVGHHKINRNEKVAVKELFHSHDYPEREMNALYLNHDNIVKLIACVKKEHWYFVVMELCDETLTELYKNSPQKVPTTQSVEYLLDITEGVKYLHTEQKIVHRDLKPQNILMKEGRAKIADFGLACKIRESPNTNSERTIGVGTTSWQAPEVHTNNYSYPIDVFALALVFLSMIRHIVGKPLQAHTEKGHALGTWMELKKKFPKLLEPSDDWLVRTILDLIKQMIHFEPTKRIDITSVREQLHSIHRIAKEVRKFDLFRIFIKAPTAVVRDMYRDYGNTMGATFDPHDPQASSPGLLFTHDWKQLHTSCGLLDTTIQKVDPGASSCCHTVRLEFTNAFQLEAFVNSLYRSEIDRTKSCPLHLPIVCDIENLGDCTDRPVSAIIKMTYKITHTMSETSPEKLLSDSATKALHGIEAQILAGEVPKEAIVLFLKKFGSHFPRGVQRLGTCFSRMVIVDEQCNMDLLREIAEEVFVMCDKYAASFYGLGEGVWYSLQNIPHEEKEKVEKENEKTKLLQTARLCIVHRGSNEKFSFTEWKQNDSVNRPVKIDPISGNIVSVWDLIEQSHMKFQVHKTLSLMIREEWMKLAKETKHSSLAPISMIDFSIPLRWGNLLNDLGMQDDFPAKVHLQKIRSLHIQKEGQIEIKDLPRKILNQLMLLNSMCRVEAIEEFAKEKKGKPRTLKDRKLKRDQGQKPIDEKEIPHPMDVTLLIFLCSDFKLRQVLAKKLFMCHLAIPFIVPTPEDTVEILLWPLRSIVMEWRNERGANEEMLVTSNLNMIAFIRLGQTSFSKSQLINTVLSDASSSHDTFCHKDIPCGGRKRQISNGTVELSHYLPSATEKDHFPEPALFFNLRGNACDYPVQHSLMMKLATVILIIVDLQELQTNTVQKLLCETVKTKEWAIVVLTNSERHSEEQVDECLDTFCDLLGDDILDHIELLYTFKGKKERNINEMIQEVRASITKRMVPKPPHSLAALFNTYPVDECAHQNCKAGKSMLDKIFVDGSVLQYHQAGKSAVETISPQTHTFDIVTKNMIKLNLRVQQGESLCETGDLLRKLHRSSGKETSRQNKETIKQRLKIIKEEQASALKGSIFMMNVISIFHESTATRAFAMRWIQMKLDAMSRTILPKLRSEKNQKWNEMMKAQGETTDSSSSLHKEIEDLDAQIDCAAIGIEHITREIAYIYDVTADLGQIKKNNKPDLSSLPDIFAGLLLEGHPLELMDGDRGLIAMLWVKAVFQSLVKNVGEKKLFVLSVMGIQSSGKSTLLNTLFGLEFPVSAGRCTRGIYAQLLPVTTTSELPFDYMLVLDTEGLRAQGLRQQSYEYDNELATFVVGISDLTLINMKGENVMEITDILQIVVLAFLRMKHADLTQRNKCMFIHQNVPAVNAEEKLAVERQKFQEQLNKMTKLASESQGLHQIITSFNQVISFDGEQDVIYFSDLWHGDPPMAPVNQGYSMRAAKTRQRILTEASRDSRSLFTISDFVIHFEDMWKGVLADDFVFSFRNSLAAKAYLTLERKFARLTMEMEDSLLLWINKTCNPQMHNCRTEQDVETKCSELKSALRERVSELHTENSEKLDKFFQNYPVKEVIMQWKEEKEKSLKEFMDNLFMKIDTNLENMKKRTLVQKQMMSTSKEQAILKEALSLAERLRVKSPLKEALQEEFDKIWNPWAEDCCRSLNVQQELFDVLWETLETEGIRRFLTTEMIECARRDPAPLHKEITINDLKDGAVKTVVTVDDDFYVTIAERANGMMTDVKKEVNKLGEEDVMFDKHHGRKVITYALKAVRENNKQKHNSIPFSFTQQFKVLIALRVVIYATATFENMNTRYKERHGIHTKLKHLKQRVFKHFENTVQNETIEVTILDDFCETMREALVSHVRLEIDQQVVKELHHALGFTKYELITKILDDIVTTKDFSDMSEYVHNPVAYGRKWIETFGHRLIFGEYIPQSRYKQLVHTYSNEFIAKIKAITRAATDSVVGMESAQYSTWIGTFREEMEQTILLNARQPEVTGPTDIKDFEHFQTRLEEKLDNLKKNLAEELCSVTAESVTWANETNPFNIVYDRLWGCLEICPLCKEPCQYSDPNHVSTHSCIQHRPAGVRGTKDGKTRLLITNTCNMDIASTERAFNCEACSFECRKTSHCTGNTDHYYRKYKKFLPRWDIKPDQAEEASKFWKWVMCTFKDELVEEYKKNYKVGGVNIPESWKDITEQAARDSLKKFFQ